jgi:hypothetical protein
MIGPGHATMLQMNDWLAELRDGESAGPARPGHADPASLGEADARARAIYAGWRIDAVGRLACPRCQQTDPGFRVSSQVVPWDRRAAAGTARVSRAALRNSRDLCRAVSGYPPAGRETERDHDFPVARAMPAGRRAERGQRLHSRGGVLTYGPVRADGRPPGGTSPSR